MSKLITHEDYDVTVMLHDIGVAKLATPISPIEEFEVKLPPYGYSNVLTGSTAVLVGWGTNDAEAPFPITSTLQAVHLLASSAWDCEKIYRKHNIDTNNSYAKQILETNICAGDSKDASKRKGMCYGDIGSPLFVDGIQVGIVSHSPDPCGLLPDTFTAVSFYVNWIAEKTGLNLKPNLFLKT